MGNFRITNLTEVNLDFQRYGNHTDTKNGRTIRKFGLKIINSARGILWKNVIKWTGNLANSIGITSISLNEVEVAPDTEYDKWIEVGGRGGFKGYKYMSGALKKHKDAFLEEIKNNLKV